jgi:branched-chain amino acid transport system permease protein
LIAIGLTIIFGMMGVINFAHGALYAIGAFIAAWIIIAVGAKVPPFFLYITLLSGLILTGIVGLIMEKSLIRFMYKRTLEYQLLLTFGALMLLEDPWSYYAGCTPEANHELMLRAYINIKKFEEFLRGTAREVWQKVEEKKPKGEYVIVVEGKKHSSATERGRP